MADLHHRVPGSLPGKFYVDDSCIYCDLCHEIIAEVFSSMSEFGWASVLRQPATAEELLLTLEAVEGCPTASIGSDGDTCDWEAVPSRWAAAPPFTVIPLDQRWRFR